MSLSIKESLEGLAEIAGERSGALSPDAGDAIVRDISRGRSFRRFGPLGAAVAAGAVLAFGAATIAAVTVFDAPAANSVAEKPPELPANGDGANGRADYDGRESTALGDVDTADPDNSHSMFPDSSPEFVAGYAAGYELGRSDGYAAGLSGGENPADVEAALGRAKAEDTYAAGYGAGYALGFRAGYGEGTAEGGGAGAPEHGGPGAAENEGGADPGGKAAGTDESDVAKDDGESAGDRGNEGDGHRAGGDDDERDDARGDDDGPDRRPDDD